MKITPRKGLSPLITIIIAALLIGTGIIVYQSSRIRDEAITAPTSTTSITPSTPLDMCIKEHEIASIDSNQFCCQNLVKLLGGNGETEFTCGIHNVKGVITNIDNQNLNLSVKISNSDIRGWNSGEIKEIRVWSPAQPPSFYVTNYTVEPVETGGFENLKTGDTIEAFVETAVIGDYAHGINITSPQMEEQVIRERIDEFMGERIKRNSEKVVSYLTEKAILGLGGEGEAKQYLTGLTNPHLYKYEITSITEIPKGTLCYSKGGYKVIIKGYEKYTGEGEVGSFVEGLNLIEVNSQWFINEVIEKRYN